MANKLKELSQKYGISQSGIAYRLQRGIPLDAPRKNGTRGGNFKITRDTASKVWRGICSIRRGKIRKTHAQLAEQLGVKVTIVKSIAWGRSWNDVTGLPRKPKNEWDSL